MVPAVDGDLPVEQALAGGAPQRVGSWRFYFADERWEWSPEVERFHGYGPLGFAATAEVLALRRVGKQPVGAPAQGLRADKSVSPILRGK